MSQFPILSGVLPMLITPFDQEGRPDERSLIRLIDQLNPENEPDRTRWRWHFPIRPLVALRDLRDAPPVEAAGVLPSSLGRHSYIRLTEAQFDAARRAIEVLAAAA